MSVMTEEQARALLNAISSFAADNSLVGQDVVVSVTTQGATGDPTARGQIHDLGEGHLTVNVDPGGTNNCVPIGWDVIELVTVEVE